ncbi:MAG: hypothetical protein FIA94_08625 [Nitrospirae bacterium]|nr:hypothetical protein [Nitrospirota bacterium]
MPAKKTVVYECTVCGTEVTVTSEGLSDLGPVYCCDIALGASQKGVSPKPAAKITSKKKTTVHTAKVVTKKSLPRKVKKAVPKKYSKM